MPTQQAPARPAPAGKHDAAAAAQLARALRRVRNLDVAAGFLVLLAGTLLYALATVCAARWLSAAPLAQQLALAGFILLAVAWLAWAVLRPLFRPINPYFAARRLEATLPAARNSVINWLDLRDQPLPPAIRAAVLRRAAHDLSRADLDRAFSARRLAWAGGFVGLLCVGLLAALIGFGPSQFFARLLHGFFPFASGDIPNRTQLTVVRPEGGNATVPVGRAVSILVAVEGRTPDPRGPDALRLLFRHGPAEPYQERLLEPEDNWQWGTALPAAQVRTGFWYKVAGGDAETPEYHVTARATPLVEKVETVFHFPQYLRRRDETGTDFNLKAPRGTDVQLTAHANRKVKAGRLDVEGKQGRKSYAGEVAPGDANALRFRFPIDQDGQYRVWFTTLEGEANTDPPAWSVTAIPDGPPAVELKVPGKDVTLPADGVLELEGSASDDVGVKRMTLRMRVVGGAALKEKPYRDGKTFELEAGGYPLTLDYFDFVELDKLHNAEGKPVFLQPG
ncbi:MAG TPA: DUF4175 family protein, partial [Gemmataceae bacterium]|nr:DUF4175 family protein [Gemmataceae bacterium]